MIEVCESKENRQWCTESRRRGPDEKTPTVKEATREREQCQSRVYRASEEHTVYNMEGKDMSKWCREEENVGQMNSLEHMKNENRIEEKQ